MAELNREFIVNLQGKDFVTYNGLIDLAHQIGLKEITTELIQIPTEENGKTVIVKARVVSEDGRIFEGYGDADEKNVNRMIANHKIRMAETRAKARALRDFTNVGMTAIEELGGDDSEEVAQPNVDKQNVGGISEKQIARLFAIANTKGIKREVVEEQVQRKFKKAISVLTRSEYDIVCKGYEGLDDKS